MTIHANPPKRCDLCPAEITTEFADCLVPRAGRWGNLCPLCTEAQEVSFGTGLGQLYQLSDDGRYHKVRG